MAKQERNSESKDMNSNNNDDSNDSDTKKEFDFIGPSKEIISSLNYGKFPDRFPRFIGDESRNLFEYEWKSPVNLDSELPFELKGRTKHEKRFAILYANISHALFPFWCYCIDNNGPGLMFIEIENSLKHFGRLDTVMNANTLKFVDNPVPIYAIFLNITQIKYYLQQKLRKKDEINKNIDIAIDAHKTSKIKMGIVFSMLNENDTSITMDGGKSFHSDTFQRELKTFYKCMEKNSMKYCNYIQLNIKTKTIYGYYFGHLYHTYNVKFNEMILPKCEALYALNKDSPYGIGYPNFYKYGVNPVLLNNKILPFKFEDYKEYKTYDNAQRDKIVKLFRMNKLYQHYLANVLYPFWCYSTKKYGIGSIFIEGLNPDTNKLNNLVNKKGKLVSNPIDLVAIFLPFDILKRFLLFYGDRDPTKSIELQSAQWGYQNKRDRISVIFSFRDTKMFYSLNGVKSEENGEFEQELKRFKNILNIAKMQTCHYMVFNLKKKYSIAFEIKDRNNIITSLTELREQIKNEFGDDNIDVSLNDDDILMKYSEHVCANCNKSDDIRLRCSRCKKVWYCGVNCQKKHWKKHKKTCKKSE